MGGLGSFLLYLLNLDGAPPVVVQVTPWPRSRVALLAAPTITQAITLRAPTSRVALLPAVEIRAKVSGYKP